jgi:hypothetical protein
MKVGKAKMGFKARKDIDGDAGCFHRGGHGRKARNIKARRKAIETRVRRQGKAACHQDAS